MTEKPPLHSQATSGDEPRLIAPSATRNLEPICALLQQIGPPKGAALEIASGTGQHIVAFAARMPQLDWQPTEPDAERRASIDAHSADANLPNLFPSVPLDASLPGWGKVHAGKSLIVLINLLHLIGLPQTRVLIVEAADALAPGGILFLYGPFLRDGDLISDGDARFHAGLVEQDPSLGYKNDTDILDLATGAGLTLSEKVEMPANNLALVLEKPAN